jgi:hypothetical protein
MGLGEEEFRHPSFSGEGGLPVNIERLLRRLDQEFGRELNPWEIPLAAIHLRSWMDRIEDYWERGAGSEPLPDRGPHQNLGVLGFEIQDAYQLTAGLCEEALEKPSDAWLLQLPEQAMFRIARRVLNPTHSRRRDSRRPRSSAPRSSPGGNENPLRCWGTTLFHGDEAPSRRAATRTWRRSTQGRRRRSTARSTWASCWG